MLTKEQKLRSFFWG